MALTNKESPPDHCREPTMPHGACRDKSAEDSSNGSILHPRQPPSCSCEDETTDASTEVYGICICTAHTYCIVAKFGEH